MPLSEASYLFLVPFKVRQENKASLWVWIFKNYSFNLCPLLKDVIHPLQGKKNQQQSQNHRKKKIALENILEN